MYMRALRTHDNNDNKMNIFFLFLFTFFSKFRLQTKAHIISRIYNEKNGNEVHTMLLGRGEGNKALCANRMKEMKNSALSKCVENLDLFTFISHTQLFRQMAVINFQQKKINSNNTVCFT